MLTSEDLIFFTILAGEQSLTAAARRLNVTASAVTQRLKALESRLGLRLIQRNGRALLLTDEGSMLAKTGGILIGNLNSLNEQLLARRGVVSGPLRIIAPLGFGRRYISPVCISFKRLYPDVAIDLSLSDKIGRYPEQSWDLAVHVGELEPTGLKVRTVARNKRFICASPAYLSTHPAPLTPVDLRQHQCLVLRENNEDSSLWKFTKQRQTYNVRVDASISTNDGDTLRQWALSDMGVMIRSEWDVADDIAKGQLVRLLPDYEIQDADVVLLVDASSEQRLRTTTFVHHLIASLTPAPWRAASVSPSRD